MDLSRQNQSPPKVGPAGPILTENFAKIGPPGPLFTFSAAKIGPAGPILTAHRFFRYRSMERYKQRFAHYHILLVACQTYNVKQYYVIT